MVNLMWQVPLSTRGSRGLMIGRPVQMFRTRPQCIQFISMIWGEKNLSTADEAAAKKSGAGILLNFNQPNNLGAGSRQVRHLPEKEPGRV
jgi:hypothetical protein